MSFIIIFGTLSLPVAYFSEDERLFVVDRVKAVVGYGSGAELLANRVRRQPVHVHLDVSADLLVRQKLTGYHLRRQTPHQRITRPTSRPRNEWLVV